MEEKIIEELKDILEIQDQELSLVDNFKQFDNWDSIANISVIAMLDEDFGVLIPTEDFKRITTVQELIDEVKKRM